MLDPIRNRLLSELREPASASDLAERLAILRQKVNYHLRALESLGLVSVASTRKWGGLTERLVVAKAASFVISPDALGPLTADPDPWEPQGSNPLGLPGPELCHPQWSG